VGLGGVGWGWVGLAGGVKGYGCLADDMSLQDLAVGTRCPPPLPVHVAHPPQILSTL